MKREARLQIASVAKETGALLKEYLTKRGLTLDLGSNQIICYGVPSSSPLALNGECGGGDKIRRLVQMKEGGVRTVPWFKGDQMPVNFKFPALARHLSGHGGEDIVPVFQAQEVPWRIAAGWAWFSSYVPLRTEYRVWIFRGEHLDTYEKKMNRPSNYAYIGRNFRNGFDFIHQPEPPVEAVEQAQKCIRALNFDFGAVDMLMGEDEKIYVLECNTAPGVIKSGAQATLAKLADRMVNWVDRGCPRR